MRDNNFDLIRLVAALFVIITHSYTLLGEHDKELLIRFTSHEIAFSDLGVWAFFILSGFLIHRSIQRSHSIKDFFWKRFIRIYPALIVVVFLSSIILGPLISTLSIKDYFSNKLFYNYLWTASCIQIHYFLPGVFQNNPYKGFVNGSLWTLQYEILMYIVIGGLLFFKQTRFRSLIPFIVLILFQLILGFNLKFEVPFVWINIKQIAFLGQFFFMGVIISQQNLDKRISMLNTWFVLIVFATSLFLFEKGVIGTIFLPLLIFNLSYKKVKFLKQLTVYGDFSYGIYIYAFLIQQILIDQFNIYNIWNLAVITFILSIIMGAASWFIIEKPCMKYRNILTDIPAKPKSLAISVANE